MHVGAEFEAADGAREVLVGTLNLEHVWRVVDRLRVGEHGYALLVDGRGRLFAHGHPDRKSAIARGDALDAHPLARQALSGDAHLLVAEEYEDEAGVRRLAAAARVPTVGWLLILEQPTVEAFALADRLRRWLLAAIAITSIVDDRPRAVARTIARRPDHDPGGRH